MIDKNVRLPLNIGVKFQAPMPPSFIHWPNETSNRAYGIPTATEDIRNGIKKAPISILNY